MRITASSQITPAAIPTHRVHAAKSAFSFIFPSSASAISAFVRPAVIFFSARTVFPSYVQIRKVISTFVKKTSSGVFQLPMNVSSSESSWVIVYSGFCFLIVSFFPFTV